jgi:hypothetical protein
MRYGIGLLSLLIVIALSLVLMVNTGYLKSVQSAQKQANTQINVISGYSPDRKILATDSVRYKVVNSGSKSKLIVTGIYLTGPMDEKYGLRKDDQIIEIGSLDVAQIVTSKEDATAFLHDAYARGYPLTILRNGQKITLPTPEHLAAITARKKAEALAATTQAAVPVTPSAPAAYEPGALEKTIDSLWK